MAIRQEAEEPLEIQLTSLIDCVFLLLIFFLVSSQMKKIEKELPIELPVANATREVKAPPDLVTVSVLAPRTGDLAESLLYVNGVPVGPDGLKDLETFADRLKQATLDTIRGGIMTKDLAVICDREVQGVGSFEFLDAIARKLAE